MINVSIIEDDKDIRNGIQSYLNYQKDMQCTFAFDSVEMFMAHIAENVCPDVLLLDIELPGMSGIEGMRVIKNKCQAIDIMMLTIFHDSDKIFRSLCAGAAGYLLKNTPLTEIREHILTIHAGGAPMSPQIARKVTEYFSKDRFQMLSTKLTDREREVVQGLVDGLSYKLIANQMSITMETVRFHIKNIYKKLEVNSKGEVISKFLKSNI